MASFFDQFLGAEVELPDGMPAEQRQNALGQLYQQRRLQNAMQTLGYLGQTIMGNGGLTGQSAPRRPAPIDPRAAFVMTPQALQSYTRQQEEAYQADASRYDAQQNRAAENQRQNQILAAQERIEVKRQLQAEKDSADKFKLQKMQYDNLMADRQFREKQAADKAKAEEKEEQEKLKRGTVHTRSDGSMINIYWDGNQWNVRPVAGAPALSQGYGGGGSGGGSHGGGGGGSRGGGGEGVAVDSLAGVIPTKLPDGTTGYVNPETKQVMTKEQYAYQQKIDDAWEEKYSPKLGHVLYNTITQETRALGGGPDTGGSGGGTSPSSSRGSKGPQTADEWVRENFKPVPGGTKEDDAAELQRLRGTAALMFPESQANAIPPMPQIYPVPKGFPNPEPPNTAAPRKAIVNGVPGYVQSDGTFVPDDPNAY